MRRWESDADRIATIVERLDRNQRVWGPDIAWLVDALETAQAENQRLEGVMECMIAGGQDYQALEAERDAVQAENTRLATELRAEQDADVECEMCNHSAISGGVFPVCSRCLNRERDRLTNQITDLRQAIWAIKLSVVFSEKGAFMKTMDEATVLASTPTRCKFCGSTDDGPIGTDGLMVCPDCAAEATT